VETGLGEIKNFGDKTDMSKKDPHRFCDSKITTEYDTEYRVALEEYFPKSIGSSVEKLLNFCKYVPRSAIMRFLCKYEIFKQTLNVQGSVIECGVLFGGGLMTFAQLSAILEPINHQRKIIGFDTFSGFASVMKEDKAVSTSEQVKKGGLALDSFKDLQECIQLYNINRPLNHIEKVKLVRGDIKETVPQYIKENPHTVVCLLYLDVDLFEPTLVALEQFVPRIPKGGIIAFDELNAEGYPGETIAVMQKLGIKNLRIQRPTFGTYISYIVVE
jgi:hypothetical protein